MRVAWNGVFRRSGHRDSLYCRASAKHGGVCRNIMALNARTADKPRIQYLDASRGISLLLVCFSHFVAVYFGTNRQGGLGNVPRFPLALGMISSPTFVAVSGTILGLLFVVQRD